MIMNNITILATTPLSENYRSRLCSLSSSIQIIESVREEDHLSEEIASHVNILLLSKGKWLDKSRVKSMPNLRLVQTMSAGVDSIDFNGIPEQVIVCGNVGAYSEQIAEHAFGMIICLARNLVVRNEQLRKGIFDHSVDGIFLSGKTIGIIGTGGIGQSVAKLAKAFGMKTMGINSSGKSAAFFDHVSSMDGLNQLLSHSDVVVIAIPLTIKTINLINESNLALTKPRCILINVARGPIINEKALYDHLRANPGFKAGLDVWWRYPSSSKEPFSQHFPFFDLPNFLGSPHNSGDIPESEELALNNAIKNIERFIRREPLKGIAKREDYLELPKIERMIL
jgi:phosphoglycerate dehydrogenase-like enzyme